MEDKKAENTIEIEDTRPEYMKKRVLVPAITAIVFLICGIFYGVHTVYYKSTDDAFVEGHIITVAPRVSGPVLKLNIEDNQEVKKGDLLLEIDPNDYQAKLKQTRAKLEEAYDFMRQFTINGMNMLEHFLRSIGEWVQQKVAGMSR